MYFWLKLLHIAAMAVWFAGLFLLPRLLLSGGGTPSREPGCSLFHVVMTPAAVATIVLGMLLLARGASGAWLPAKLLLVAMAVLLHVHFGQRLYAREEIRGADALLLKMLNWLPLPLLLGIAALAAVKPQQLLPGGG